MSKRPDTSLSESCFAALAAEGIDGATLASGSQPAERLAEILASGTPASLALAQLLGKEPRPENAELLAAVEDTAHGPLRREVRRALYRLSQAGIAPPPRTSAEPIATSLIDTLDPPEGWLSHVDGGGDQIVWISKPGPSGVLFISARINDREGLCKLTALETSRRRFRAQRNELRDRHGLRMVAVDWRHADALLTDAHARGAPKSGQQYPQLRTRITAEPGVPLEPPIYGHIPRDSVSPDLVQESADLLDAPEMHTWQPAPSVLEAYVREILEARESPLVLSRHQQDDRLGDVLDRAVDEIYVGEIYAPRFETMAYYFWEIGRERHARIALAAAQALAGGTPAHVVPVLTALLRHSLSSVYESAKTAQQEQERDSLIIKPTVAKNPRLE